jgi:hypothetical protein
MQLVADKLLELELVDVHFPDAVLISAVQDNLNTRTGEPCTRHLSRPRLAAF